MPGTYYCDECDAELLDFAGDDLHCPLHGSKNRIDVLNRAIANGDEDAVADLQLLKDIDVAIPRKRGKQR